MSKSASEIILPLAMLSWLLVGTTPSSAQTTATSRNWAGYVVSDAAYSNVSASWVVPAVDCSTVATGKYSASFAWVGLGGYNDANSSAAKVIEQIGTAQMCMGSAPVYLLYYEFLPAAQMSGDANYPLSAGNTVTARVTRNLDGSYTLSETATAKGAKSSKWTFSIKGSSPGTSTLDPGNTSAEIIIEQPGDLTLPTRPPVANYGSITFFDLAYTKASTASDHATAFQYSNFFDGNTLGTSMAVPSILSPTSFIVYQF